MKKQANKISTEDLLKALGDENTEEIKAVHDVFDYRNDVPLFLQKYGIEAGPHKVLNRHLHSLYLHFSENPVSITALGFALGEFLQREQTSFLINIPRAEFTALVRKETLTTKNRYSVSKPLTRKHIERFFEENGLERGNKWLLADKLFPVYKSWCKKNRKHTRFKHKQFTKLLGLYFEVKPVAGHRTYFKINPDLFLAKQKEIALNDEKNKEIESKISSSETRIESQE